jgi:hypothetical protein
LALPRAKALRGLRQTGQHAGFEGAYVVDDVFGEQRRHPVEVAAIGQMPMLVDQICDGVSQHPNE